METLVIIPTYNEADNVRTLLQQILDLPVKADVLVVDDNSPDGTAEIVSKDFGTNERVHLLCRDKKRGLGTAYTAGFRFALENNYSNAITMDADFSHDPMHIPRFCEVPADIDLVIGSRYIPGGATINWGISRKVISRTANAIANHFLSLNPRDCTSGFRLYRSETLRQIEFDTIHADGYSYLVEILFRASARKMNIQEIPIHFVERRHGKSKISRKEIFKAVRTMISLRLKRPEFTRSAHP